MVRYPEVFWLLLVFIPLLVLFQWRYRVGKQAVQRLGGKWRGGTLQEIYVVKWFFSSLGFALFFLGCLLALAGFPGSARKEPFTASGWDTVFVMDISRSMLARDTVPSRLERAKGIIDSLSGSLESGRFGLVIFRGDGSRLLPLSEDRNALTSALGVVSPDLMSSPGTSIAGGLEKALDSFVSGSETSRRIILFSDGEEFTGDTGGVTHRFREEQVSLTVIGLGKTEGAFIPLPDGSRVKDSYGRDVITRLNVRTLERLAEQAGGIYLSGEDPELQSLLIQEYTADTASQGSGFIMVETERYRIFILMALVGLLLYQGVKAGRWKDDF